MAKRGSGKSAGTVRVIGGRWRGYRLRCLPGERTRPTGDRIRETLFNWLAPRIVGARCLDLFAGTGALGIEALSRGADAVTFVESDAAAVGLLAAAIDELGCGQARIVAGDALDFLAGDPERYDIVFLDPPFGLIDTPNLCTLLDGGWLAPGARVYLETAPDDRAAEPPAGWTALRDKTAGRVRYRLLCGGDPDAVR